MLSVCEIVWEWTCLSKRVCKMHFNSQFCSLTCYKMLACQKLVPHYLLLCVYYFQSKTKPPFIVSYSVKAYLTFTAPKRKIQFMFTVSPTARPISHSW